MYNVYDVFISYRRKEDDGTEQGSRIAFAIYDYLTKKNLRVFLDKERMENGPFPEQLQWQVSHAPNYIFIATNNAMAFRQVKAPGKDYVAEEVRLALQQYQANPNDRMLLVVKPGNAPYPDKSDPKVPPEIIQLFDHRVLECKGESLDENDPVMKAILTNVTEVKRRNLWNAGSRWLEEVKKDGHRFVNLHIDQTIMPQAGIHKTDDTRFPIHAHLEDRQDAPLMDMIEKIPGHLYLIGEGGIGKTTALLSIMERVYGPGKDEKDIDRNRMNGQVPLFIELSKAPDTYGRLYEGGKSTFIKRAVYQQLRADLKVMQGARSSAEDVQEVFNLDPDTAVRPVMDLFTHQSPVPEYLLLLDGLNEVSRTEIGYTVRDGDGRERNGKSAVVSMVLQEIKDLMTNCPNVRVILTSRSREQTNWSEKTTMLYLSGVKKETIEEYLRNRELPESRITAAIQNEKLREILRIPLFLTLYAALEGDDEILTRGEILHLFFHQKKEQLYTAKNRNAAVDEDVRTAASAIQPNRLTADMQSFILDFILPEIAWRMEQNGEFYMQQKGKNGKEGLRQIILRVLADRSETSACGENGKEVFVDYSLHSSNNNARKTAKALCKRLRGDEEDEQDAEDAIVGGILENAVFSLGILQKNSGANGMEYGFIHHHFRDYFAAVQQINHLRIAVYLHTFGEDDLARECLADWREHPLHSEVRRFIGEALGEAHNAPKCDEQGNWHYAVPSEPCDRNLIKRVFDMYRGRFEGQDGYAVWNLLEILKAARVDLSGEDFSLLDLSKCEINGHAIGHRACGARLDGAKAAEDFFMPKSHSDDIVLASYSPDGRYILTASFDCTARVWDVRTLQEIGTLRGHMGTIQSAVYSPDGKHILTASHDCTAKVWDARTFQEIGTLNIDTVYLRAAYSPDGKYIITTSSAPPCIGLNDHRTRVWDARTLRNIVTLKERYCILCLSPDSRRMVMTCNDGIARVVDSRTLKMIGTLRGNLISIHSASYSPDGRYIVTACSDETARVWDARTLKEKKILNKETDIDAVFWNDPEYEDTATVFIGKDTEPWENQTQDEDDGAAWPWETQTANEEDDDTEPCDSWAKNEETGADTAWTMNAFDEPIARPSLSSVGYSPDGHYIVTEFSDESTRLWDVRTMQAVGTWKERFQFSPDGRYIVSINSDDKALCSSIKLWDAQTMQVIAEQKTDHNKNIFAGFSPNGGHFLSLADGAAWVWDTQTMQIVGDLKTISFVFYFACFSPDGSHILTCPASGGAQIWDARTMMLIGTLKRTFDPVSSACFSPDGKNILMIYKNSAIMDGNAELWDIRTMQPVGALKGDKEIYCAAYSPDGKFIVTGTYDGTAKVWDAQTLREVGTLSGHEETVYSVQYSPDGRHIITGSLDGTAKVWDGQSLQDLVTLVQENNHSFSDFRNQSVDIVQYSPDGRYILTRSSGIAIDRYFYYYTIWDAETFQKMGTMYKYETEDRSSSYSPNSRFIITASNDIEYDKNGNITSFDGVVKVWNAKTWQIIALQKAHIISINSAFFSPNGKYILTASEDGTAKIWDAQINEQAQKPQAPKKNWFARFTKKSRDTQVSQLAGLKCLHIIHNIPGLEVLGVDLRHLHPDSRLSAGIKERLYEYGAIVDERG